MKKILIIAFLFIGLKGIGQIKLPAPVIRNSPTDSTYGTHYDSLSYKGFRTSSSITTRNAIPMAVRGLGMVVNVVGDSSYTLKNGLANSNWETYKPGGGAAYTITKNATRDTIILSDGSNITKVKDSVGVPQNLQSTYIGIGDASNQLSGSSDLIFNRDSSLLKVGIEAGKNNSGLKLNALGSAAGSNNTGSNVNGLGIGAAANNTGSNVNALGQTAGINNTGSDVSFFGGTAGFNNTFSNVVIFGGIGTASGTKQFVFRNGVANSRHDYSAITADRLYTWRNQSGTVAFLTDITASSAFDSLRNNAGILEGRKAGVFIPQFILPTSSSNIYNSDGTLTSPRRVNGNGYLLKFDSTKVSFSDTSNIAGHLYDFNNGVSFVDYNSTNTSSLIQTEISGVKFSTNDRNNLDTSNNVWVKNDKVELNSTNRIDINSRTFYPATYTTAGTTGNQTINKNSGSVNIAAAITTITVTNNLVTANTIVTARVSSNDATAEILNVVSVTNGFIITMSTPATNEAQIKFWITN